jgi:hypothetical protein
MKSLYLFSLGFFVVAAAMSIRLLGSVVEHWGTDDLPYHLAAASLFSALPIFAVVAGCCVLTWASNKGEL